MRPVARELGFLRPGVCCGVGTVDDGAYLGPLQVLHGGVHASTLDRSHTGVCHQWQESWISRPGDCCLVWTAEEMQGACLGPLLVLHGGVHAAHWKEVMQGYVTSGKRAGPPRYQRTVVGVGTAAAEEEFEAMVDVIEAVANLLGWGSFSHFGSPP